MNCSEFDAKGYALEELSAAERRTAEEHLAACAECREQVEALRLTVFAMRRVPEREIPRRISFVSDPVFAPTFWQRFWNSGPKLGFASAAMLALAIVAHGFTARVAAPAPAGLVDTARIEARIQEEVDKRLPAAVDARIQTQLKPAMAELALRLDNYEKQNDEQRRAELRDVKGAFDAIEKRMSVMYLSNARFGGD